MPRAYPAAAILSTAAVLLAVSSCADAPTATSPTPDAIPARSLDVAATGMVLQQTGGFSVRIVATECAAQGNRVTVVSPVFEVLATNACYQLGASRTYAGPFPAGTAISLSFFSGFTRRPGTMRLSGSYPIWTAEFEDGFDNDFNDVVMQVIALPVLAEVRVTPVAGSWTVRPKERGDHTLELDVGVYDPAGNPIPNRTVLLGLLAVEGSGGHDHLGGKPAGEFTGGGTVNTGPTGVTTVVYEAPTPSGEVMLGASSEDAEPVNEIITVAIGGLEAFATSGAGYTFQESSRHSSADNFLAPGVIGVMQQIWTSYIAEHQNDPAAYPMRGDRFTITAASLVWGGLYDWRGTWAPPHSTHRSGGDVDFDDADAEGDPQLMERHCAQYSYGGRPVVCQLHNGNHFHAYVGSNR